MPYDLKYPFVRWDQLSPLCLLSASCALPASFLVECCDGQDRPRCCSAINKNMPVPGIKHTVSSKNPKHNMKKINSILAKICLHLREMFSLNTAFMNHFLTIDNSFCFIAIKSHQKTPQFWQYFSETFGNLRLLSSFCCEDRWCLEKCISN